MKLPKLFRHIIELDLGQTICKGDWQEKLPLIGKDIKWVHAYAHLVTPLRKIELGIASNQHAHQKHMKRLKTKSIIILLGAS